MRSHITASNVSGCLGSMATSTAPVVSLSPASALAQVMADPAAAAGRGGVDGVLLVRVHDHVEDAAADVGWTLERPAAAHRRRGRRRRCHARERVGGRDAGALDGLEVGSRLLTELT